MRPAVHVFVHQVGSSYADLAQKAHKVESCGYDAMWLVDHFWAVHAPDSDLLEPWTAVAGLAQATKELRLGVMVSCNAFRTPGLLAKVVTTADHISGGRIELGMGAGWMEEEFVAYGYEFAPIGERLAALGESLEVLRSLFTEKTTTFVGEHYQLDGARFEPKPVQSPLPITIGGAGRRVLLKLVAGYAQRWNCPMPAAGELPSLVETLRAHCGEIGRDPSEIAISEQVAVVIGADESGYRAKRELAERTVGGFIGDLDAFAVCGTPSKIADELNEKLARGVDELAVIFGDLGMDDTLELFASRVVPELETV